jgi:hypothetical protein
VRQPETNPCAGRAADEEAPTNGAPQLRHTICLSVPARSASTRTSLERAPQFGQVKGSTGFDGNARLGDRIVHETRRAGRNCQIVVIQPSFDYSLMYILFSRSVILLSTERHRFPKRGSRLETPLAARNSSRCHCGAVGSRLPPRGSTGICDGNSTFCPPIGYS